MSMEAMEKFTERLKQDKTLQEQAKEIGDQVGVIRFAKENGYDFTAAEMEAFLARPTENAVRLSDEELGMATGGARDEVGRLLTTVCYGCSYWKPTDETWLAVKGQCGSCYYWASRVHTAYLFWVGVPGVCKNQSNRQ